MSARADRLLALVSVVGMLLAGLLVHCTQPRGGLLGMPCRPIALGPGVTLPDPAKVTAADFELLRWAQSREWVPRTSSRRDASRLVTLAWDDARSIWADPWPASALVTDALPPRGSALRPRVFRAEVAAARGELRVVDPVTRLAVQIGGRTLAVWSRPTGLVCLVDRWRAEALEP